MCEELSGHPGTGQTREHIISSENILGSSCSSQGELTKGSETSAGNRVEFRIL